MQQLRKRPARNYFASTDLFDQIDDSCNRIAFAPPMSERRMNGILNREFDFLAGAARPVIAELRTQDLR